MKYFQKEETSYLEREQFLEIMNDIFKALTPLEREAIIFQYTDWEHLNNGFLYQKAVGDVVGDYYFICPSNLFANLYAKHCDSVYYYFFTHRTSNNPWGKWMGVLHADEIDYVFGHPLNKSEGYSDSEAELARRIMGYYKKFAATGKPVDEKVNWPKYTEEEPQYFEWNAARESIGKGPRATPCAFWNELMPLLEEKGGKAEETPICESEMQKALNEAVSLRVKLVLCLFGLLVARFI
ncbi:acetylcholinesterase-like isoform X1 [Palaemon carinicauda]|uniref:acetylcholinesterase-like isoform X1 n=1 Tax=Palaemon carinicauda TaxID=392227 RepID=UPI0035B5F6A0